MAKKPDKPQKPLIQQELRGLDIESAYQLMAEDKTREAEAIEWTEAMIEDAETTR